MMMWRALSARTICQAAEAIAARRADKGRRDPAAAGAPGTDAKTSGTILPLDTTTRTPDSA